MIHFVCVCSFCSVQCVCSFLQFCLASTSIGIFARVILDASFFVQFRRSEHKNNVLRLINKELVRRQINICGIQFWMSKCMQFTAIFMNDDSLLLIRQRMSVGYLLSSLLKCSCRRFFSLCIMSEIVSNKMLHSLEIIAATTKFVVSVNSFPLTIDRSGPAFLL